MTKNNNLITARQLLELISPDGKIFEQSLEILEEDYPELSENDLSLLSAFHHAGAEKSIFAAQEEDLIDLIQQLRTVASYWEADIFLGNADGEEESLLYELDIEEILARAASELHSYGLILWRWQTEKTDIYFGFFSREEDQSLIERCGKMLKEEFQFIENDF